MPTASRNWQLSLADTFLRPIEKKRKRKGIFEDSNQKIKALLNEQQKQRYTRLEQQMRDHIESRGDANSSDPE